MSLKYVPPKAPFLITSTGLIFGLNSTYNIPLSLKSEIFEIKTGAFLSTPII